MNTDPCLSVLLSRKSFASCQGFSSAVLLGAHASCVQGVGHPGHAGSVRSQGRNLRVLCVSAVRFFLVVAELLRVYLCSFVVSLLVPVLLHCEIRGQFFFVALCHGLPQHWHLSKPNATITPCLPSFARPRTWLKEFVFSSKKSIS